MDKYLISIIMPTFNRGYIIDDAIQSVFNQTISNWELIIIDDASTDNTQDIIGSYNDSRIVYIKNEKNRGANYSRNRGCQLARGNFLAFLDSDNVWANNKLEKQLVALRNSRDNIAFTFCKIMIVDEKKSIVPDREFDINQLEKIIRKRNVIDMNSVLLKKEVFNIVDGFDDDMLRMQDWDIFFRIIVVYQYTAIYMPEILGTNVMQPNSISKSDYRFQMSIRRFLKKYSKFLNSEEVAYHFIGTLKKAKNREEAVQLINELADNGETKKEDLFVALAENFYDYSKYYITLLRWKIKMEKSIGRTIFSPNYKWENCVIALYGLGVWGDLIYYEAKNCGIKIEYGIDKSIKQFRDVKIIKMHEIPKSVNLIIVSIFQEYDKISKQLAQYYEGEIISIEDLINGIES